jgi:hypothetical protein
VKCLLAALTGGTGATVHASNVGSGIDDPKDN